MRIAQICSSFEQIAGTERFVLETTRELLKRGVETRIYTASGNNCPSKDAVKGVSLQRIGVFSIPLLDFYSNLAVSKRLIDTASSWADVMILHTGLGMADYAWRKYKLPCAPFFHIDKYDPSSFGFFRAIAPMYTYPLKILETKCIRTVPLTFANSHSLCRRVRQYAKGGNLFSIPLGVDVERFYPKWTDGEFLLMVGRYHPMNNFELGLRAAMKTNCKVIIAGIYSKRFSRYYELLRRFVKESVELRNRVEFLNPSDDQLISLMQNCSVFLSPRKYDYLGLAALEAMACGKPVIAYNVDEETEASIAITRCGDRPWAWQEAVAALLNDRDRRQAIGRQSRVFVERDHTWMKTVDVMLNSIKTSIHRDWTF